MKFNSEQMTRFVVYKENALKNFKNKALGIDVPEEDWNPMATLLAAMAVMSPTSQPLHEDDIKDTIEENKLEEI